MSLPAVVILLLLGVILYMQARKRGETKQGRTIRHVALAIVLGSLAIAVFDVLDMVQDHDASDSASEETAMDTGND